MSLEVDVPSERERHRRRRSDGRDGAAGVGVAELPAARPTVGRSAGAAALLRASVGGVDVVQPTTTRPTRTAVATSPTRPMNACGRVCQHCRHERCRVGPRRGWRTPVRLAQGAADQGGRAPVCRPRGRVAARRRLRPRGGRRRGGRGVRPRAPGGAACARRRVPELGRRDGESLRAGLAALDDLAVNAAVVTLVDLPDVGSDVVARLVAASSANGPSAPSARSALVRAAYGGRPGHPVVLGRDHWSGIREMAEGDRGARDYLATHPPHRRVRRPRDRARCRHTAGPHGRQWSLTGPAAMLSPCSPRIR